MERGKESKYRNHFRNIYSNSGGNDRWQSHAGDKKWLDIWLLKN